MTYRICKKLNKENNYKEIEQALEINNNIWNVKSTLNEFFQRADNSYLIALFENNILKGTISGISLNRYDILNNNKFHTWNGVTQNGSFSNVNKNGDTLCCVAITSSVSYKDDKVLNKETENITLSESFINKNIETYLNSGLDPVINFHKKDKGIIKGAEIIKIFPNGRPDDKDSLGFNVLMQYPKITNNLRKELTKININCENMSIGKALIIGALKESLKNKNINYIMPYSRPVKYRYYLTRVLLRLKGDSLDFENDKEEVFFNSIKYSQF